MSAEVCVACGRRRDDPERAMAAIESRGWDRVIVDDNPELVTALCPRHARRPRWAAGMCPTADSGAELPSMRSWWPLPPWAALAGQSGG